MPLTRHAVFRAFDRNFRGYMDVDVPADPDGQPLDCHALLVSLNDSDLLPPGFGPADFVAVRDNNRIGINCVSAPLVAMYLEPDAMGSEQVVDEDEDDEPDNGPEDWWACADDDTVKDANRLTVAHVTNPKDLPVIAAAPALLAACRNALGQAFCNCSGPCEGTCTLSILNTAIDKAEGKEDESSTCSQCGARSVLISKGDARGTEVMQCTRCGAEEAT
jgi:hypothetical protein